MKEMTTIREMLKHFIRSWVEINLYKIHEMNEKSRIIYLPLLRLSNVQRKKIQKNIKEITQISYLNDFVMNYFFLDFCFSQL